MKILVCFFFILIFNSCSEKNRMIKCLTYPKREWVLYRVNKKILKNEFSKDRIIFHKDSSYEFFKREKGEKITSSNFDVIIEDKWYFNENNNLYISGYEGLKILTLNNNVFKFKIRYKNKDIFFVYKSEIHP